MADACSPDELESLKDAVDGLLFSVQLSARYHARRQAFYGRWRTFTSACSAVLAALAGGNAIAKNESHGLIAWATLAVAVLGAIDMVVGTAKMENKHRLLRSQFLDLQSLIDGKEDPTRKDLVKWRARRLKVEQDEPPAFHVVAYQARNELCRALGLEAELKFPFYQRWTAQVFRWSQAQPRTRPAVHEIIWARWRRRCRRWVLRQKRPKTPP